MLFKKKMLLECSSCKSAFPITKEQLARTTTKCKACHNIFEYSKQLVAAGLPVPIKEGPDFIPVQKGLEMRSLDDRLEIVMKAKDLQKTDPTGEILIIHIFLLIFTYQFITEKESFAIFYFIFMIPFFLWGLKALFSGLVFWLNTTYLTINKETISVNHTPINFLVHKDRDLMVEAIDQLFVKQDSNNKQEEKAGFTWSVNVKMKDGEVIELIKELGYYDDAQLIENEIEKYLGIQDGLVLKELNSDGELEYKVKIPSPNSKKAE